MDNNIDKLKKLRGISRAALTDIRSSNESEKITKTYRILRDTDEVLRMCYYRGMGRQGEIIDAAINVIKVIMNNMSDEDFHLFMNICKKDPDKILDFLRKRIK